MKLVPEDRNFLLVLDRLGFHVSQVAFVSLHYFFAALHRHLVAWALHLSVQVFAFSTPVWTDVLTPVSSIFRQFSIMCSLFS